MSDIKVAYLPCAIDACGLYRMFIPHINLPESRFLFRLGPLNTQELDGCKVCIVQRQVSEHNLNAIRRMKAIGLKVIYDLDDNIWNLPDWNPGKQTFEAMHAGFHMCAAEADIITVSTQGLKIATDKGFADLKKKVVIVPNSIDFDLFHPKNLTKDETVLVGWGGSNTHSEDCREAFDAVVEVLDEMPDAKIEIAGAPAMDLVDTWENIIIEGKPFKRKTKIMQSSKISMHPRSQFRRWVPVGEYANRLSSWGWDIMLAPLANHKFNWSKSCIRMLEAAAIKIPCLASNVQPYTEFASLGGDDLKWLLCDFTSQWKTKLRVLVNEPERRKYLGQKMYDVAYKWFNAKTIADHWRHAFKVALEC
jgi:glycosyltransferase involved in cell wall biosynthesis